MSNKRNRRRLGQRVRSEASRKPTRVTKAQEAFIASLPKERARKAQQRYWKKPTKAERMERKKWLYRWRSGRIGPKYKKRKTRAKYGGGL